MGGPTPDAAVPAWWDHYCQARTFVLVGFWELAAQFGATRRTDLQAFVDLAIARCRQDWAKQLTYSTKAGDFWDSFNNGQLTYAMEAQPMCLAKIGIAVTTLELFAASKQAGQPSPLDIYNHVFIALGNFRIDGLTDQYYKHLAQNHQGKLQAYHNAVQHLVAPRKAGPLLQDIVSRGVHVTYEVATIICQELSSPGHTLTPEVARRNQQQGMSPASRHLRFVPSVPLPVTHSTP